MVNHPILLGTGHRIYIVLTCVQAQVTQMKLSFPHEIHSKSRTKNHKITRNSNTKSKLIDKTTNSSRIETKQNAETNTYIVCYEDPPREIAIKCNPELQKSHSVIYKTGQKSIICTIPKSKSPNKNNKLNSKQNTTLHFTSSFLPNPNKQTKGIETNDKENKTSDHLNQEKLENQKAAMNEKREPLADSTQKVNANNNRSNHNKTDQNTKTNKMDIERNQNLTIPPIPKTPRPTNLMEPITNPPKEKGQNTPSSAINRLEFTSAITPTGTSCKSTKNTISGKKRKLSQTDDDNIVDKDEDMDIKMNHTQNTNNDDPNAPKQKKQKQTTIGSLLLQMGGIKSKPNQDPNPILNPQRNPQTKSTENNKDKTNTNNKTIQSTKKDRTTLSMNIPDNITLQPILNKRGRGPPTNVAFYDANGNQCGVAQIIEHAIPITTGIEEETYPLLKIKKAIKENKNKVHEQNKTEKQKDNLKQELNKKEKVIKNKNKKIDEMKKEIKTLKTAKTKATNKKKEMEERVKEISRKLEKSHKDIKSLKEEHKQDMKEADDGKQTAIKLYQEMSKAFTEEHDKVINLNQELEGIKRVKDEYYNQVKVCRLKLSESKEDKEKLTERNRDLKKILDEIKGDKELLESKTIEAEEQILGLQREIKMLQQLNNAQKETITNLLNKQQQNMEEDDPNEVNSDNEENEEEEQEEKRNNDANTQIPSTKTKLLGLKISTSTPNITEAPIGQQWISKNKKWCATEWDQDNSNASFRDLFEIFKDFEKDSVLNQLILKHLNEHKIGGYIPSDTYVNTYITTIAAKGATAAKFGENEHIQSSQSDFGDEIIKRAGSGFKCRFNIAQIIGVLSSKNGDKRNPLLNAINVNDVFKDSEIIAGLAPNGSKVTISRKIGGRKWDKFQINERGHEDIAFIMSGSDVELHFVETPKAKGVPLYIGFIMLFGFIPQLDFTRSLSHQQMIKNIQNKLFTEIVTNKEEEIKPENDYREDSLMQLYQMGQKNYNDPSKSNRNSPRRGNNKRYRRFNRYKLFKPQEIKPNTKTKKNTQIKIKKPKTSHDIAKINNDNYKKHNINHDPLSCPITPPPMLNKQETNN